MFKLIRYVTHFFLDRGFYYRFLTVKLRLSNGSIAYNDLASRSKHKKIKEYNGTQEFDNRKCDCRALGCTLKCELAVTVKMPV